MFVRHSLKYSFIIFSSKTNKLLTQSTIPIPEEETLVQPTASQVNESDILITNVENYFLQKENLRLKEILAKGENRLSFENIKAVDLLVFQYTGLPTAAHFQVLVELISRFQINYFMGWKVEIINIEDQLLCTLMKLRLNLQYFDLGYRFKISTTTVQNIFITYLNVLHEILFKGMMNIIPSREKNTFFIPTCFATFPNIKTVLDCTEIEVAIPASMKEQKAVFSHYKQRHTFKVLLGIAPNATITYVSDLFPGSTSDKSITKDSGILSHMLAGDLILCDKGFLISDLCAPLGVNVNIPPFLTTAQFSKEQVLVTRQIARARIHVERAISRLKSFRILDFLTPNMRVYACKIMQTCAALVNLQYSLLKENEQCFSNDSEN